MMRAFRFFFFFRSAAAGTFFFFSIGCYSSFFYVVLLQTQSRIQAGNFACVVGSFQVIGRFSWFFLTSAFKKLSARERKGGRKEVGEEKNETFSFLSFFIP